MQALEPSKAPYPNAPPPATPVVVMSARAQKKFDQLDLDSNGYLDGKEIDRLAEWVWSSFHPDKKIDDTTRRNEADKLRWRCDKNHDGKVDREEFNDYYDQVVKKMTAFHQKDAHRREAVSKPVKVTSCVAEPLLPAIVAGFFYICVISRWPAEF